MAGEERETMAVNVQQAVGGDRLRSALRVTVLALALTAVPVLAQPHSNNPITIPQSSIRHGSPTESTSVPASAILAKPGPTVVYTGAGLGLLNPQDELDDFSYDRTGALQPFPDFLLLFGVDDSTAGSAPADASLAMTGRIFNVTDQAARRQAAADLFLSLDPLNLSGKVVHHDGRSRGKNNNTLVANQGDSGGVDQDLSPAEAPVEQTAPTETIDEADGAAYPSGGSKSRNPTVFFTISRDSPSLPFMPGALGQQSGADVYKDSQPTTPENEEVYASAPSLGLLPTPLGDDIDALVVFDDGDGVLEPGIDTILFSLTRDSPSLNQGPYSPADIFISRGYGVFDLFAAAGSLGLAFSDNVDCLEIIPTNNATATAFDYAIFLVWPGDFDGNGSLNQIDCSAFLGCYSGPGIPYDTNGTADYGVLVGPGHAFYPATRTIQTGDRVHWTWMDGPHNVVSGTAAVPDGIFSSGPPAFPPTTFNLAFNEAFLNLHPKGGSLYPYFSASDIPYGMIGSITVEPHPSAVFDLDFDGDVDCADWARFQAVFAQANPPSGHCSPLSVPDFVNALLGQPVHPAHLCLADMNGDGTANGLDVQAYVHAVLGP
jgi:plastocyanin